MKLSFLMPMYSVTMWGLWGEKEGEVKKNTHTHMHKSDLMREYAGRTEKLRTGRTGQRGVEGRKDRREWSPQKGGGSGGGGAVMEEGGRGKKCTDEVSLCQLSESIDIHLIQGKQ